MKTLLKKISTFIIQAVAFVIVAVLSSVGSIIRFIARFLLVVAYALKFEKRKSVDVLRSMITFRKDG